MAPSQLSQILEVLCVCESNFEYKVYTMFIKMKPVFNLSFFDNHKF